MNKVILMGNMVRDVEVKTSQTGTRIANFAIATNKKVKGEKKAEFHNCVAFQTQDRGIVGIMEQYVSKGDKVLVEGELQTRKWQDQSGNDRHSTEVIVNQVELIGGGERRPAQPQTSGYQSGASMPEDDVPF